MMTARKKNIERENEKKEIYLYYGVLNNIHGDINYVEDGEGQQQLVEGGDHLRLPVSYSWFNLSVSRSVADTLSFIDFIFFQCFAKTKQVPILPAALLRSFQLITTL